MSIDNGRHTIFISTPLEPEHVEKIRQVDTEKLNVICDPALWPPTRYVSDHKGPADFKRAPHLEARWKSHLTEAEILFDFPPNSLDGTGGMDYAPNVKWIQTTSSGVGRRVHDLGLVDSDIMITTAGGVHKGPLAEFVMMGILNHVKRLSFLKIEQQKHHWERYCADDLAGKTLAIIGMGRVGRHVAKIAKAFDMRVIGTDIMWKPGDEERLGLDNFFTLDQLHDLLKEADALTICVPDTPQTTNMIDKEAVNILKEGMCLVNIGRGRVIDEEAMIEALKSGKIGTAYLDVFQEEPLPESSPLWDMPNVLVSPHSASTVASENGKITDIFCHNLRCYLDGRYSEMMNILDKKMLF